MKKILILTLLIFLIFSVKAQIQQEKFEQLSIQNGLSQNVVNCILQDRRGLMWFGTANGLNRYDGYQFTIFRKNAKVPFSISGNQIRCLFEDKQGFLWIGTDDNGLNRFDRKKERFESFLFQPSVSGSLVSNSVLSIYQDKSEQIWVGTRNGLCKFNESLKTFQLIDLQQFSGSSKKQPEISCIMEDSEQNLWIGTDDGVLKISKSRSEISKIEFEIPLNSAINFEVHQIFQSKDGSILTASILGVFKYNLQNKKFEQFSFHCAENQNIDQCEVYAMAEDSKQNLWFATFGKGLICWNRATNTGTNFLANSQNSKSLSTNNILSIYIDKTGLLWLGTFGDEDLAGINILDLVKINFDRILHSETNHNSLINNNVYAILQDNQHNLWLGTEAGLSVYSKEKEQFFNFTHNPQDINSISSNTIYTLFEDSEQNVWIGTSGGGLNKVEKNAFSQKKVVFQQFKKSVREIPFQNTDILCITEDSDGKIWFGTKNGLYKISRTGVIINTYFSDSVRLNSLANNTIQSIFVENDTSIWLGTANGLSNLNPKTNRFQTYLHQTSNTNSLSDNNIYAIAKDKNGFLWFGTDAGLCSLNPAHSEFSTYTTTDGLPDNVVYGILVDNEDNLWLSTNNGLSKIKKDSNKGLNFINYSKKNWLNCNSFNVGAYFKSRDGMLFFGCNEGAVLFDPKNIKANRTAPQVIMTDFQIFFESVKISDNGATPLWQHISETKKIEIDYSQNRLTFEFAALSFRQSERNEYAYMMDGLDNDWIYAKNERKASYTNLAPGHYVFRVKASNSDGIWNEYGNSIEIEILPPFYLDWWFYAAILLVLAGASYLFIRLRISAFRRRQEILEEKVMERTEEVLKQKEELVTLLENLKSTQSQLVNAEKMASLGQLTAGVAHEINNPINFINANISPLERDISDLKELISKYDEIVAKHKLKEHFAEIETFKQDIDFEYVLDEINSLLQAIQEGVRRTTEIVRGLRNFSRVDENDMKLANINEGLESTLMILRNKLKNRIEIVKEFGNLPEIMCFPGKLNQVFMNIINNASDAIEGEGTIRINTYQVSDNVCISIEDSGKGMSEEVRNRIFEPFYTTKDVGQGTGLGLYISFGIIQSMRGNIQVFSSPSKGSKFVITLPIGQE